MGKPVIFAVDDDPEVLKAVGRDLQRRYGRDYRVLRADSGPSAHEAFGKVKASNARGRHAWGPVAHHKLRERNGG